jgi:hypothetical protein
VCEDCARNNRRRFSYKKPPKIGHPGECACRNGWCRCIAQPILPA